MPDGVKLYMGSFAGTETALNQRIISSHTSLLSGDIGLTGLNIDNCYHVIVAAVPAIGGLGVTVDGFTISAGNADGSGSFYFHGNLIEETSGAGIHLYGGTNQISQNTLTYNTATNHGGAIYASGLYTNFIENTLYSNSAGFGGGIYSEATDNNFTQNVLYDNHASSRAGAIQVGAETILVDCDATFSANIFHHNFSDDIAGGVFLASWNLGFHK